MNGLEQIQEARINTYYGTPEDEEEDFSFEWCPLCGDQHPRVIEDNYVCQKCGNIY